MELLTDAIGLVLVLVGYLCAVFGAFGIIVVAIAILYVVGVALFAIAWDIGSGIGYAISAFCGDPVSALKRWWRGR